MWNTPDIFNHFQWWCCGDQSGLHLQIGLLPSSHPHLLTPGCPLIGVCGCFGNLPWIVQYPNVLDYSELVGTEIQAYQNPVEAQSILQNWQWLGLDLLQCYQHVMMLLQCSWYVMTLMAVCLAITLFDHLCQNYILVHLAVPSQIENVDTGNEFESVYLAEPVWYRWS